MSTTSSIQTVLVTGATGFLGMHTTLALLRQGYTVIGTARTAAKAQHAQALIAQHHPDVSRLSFRIADLQDSPEQWVSHLEGVQGVLHVASPFPRIQPKDDTEIIQTAKDGVLHVLQGATQAGVKRFVLVASSGTIGYGVKKQATFTEKDWTDPTNKRDTSPYFRSKTLAERAAWDYIAQTPQAPKFSVVNPGLILGPILDPKDYGTSGAVILKMLDGSMPALPQISYSLVDVRDVASHLCLALAHPKAVNERFISTSAHLSIPEMADILRAQFPNRKLPKVKLPDFIVRLFALFDPQTAPVVLELQADRRFSAQKAKEVLDWSHRSAEATIRDTAQSLLDLNFVS